MTIAAASPGAGATLWQPVGPFGGSAAVVRVSHSQPDVLLAATRNALLFRSLDRGTTWTHVRFPTQFSGHLHTIEIDPEKPNTWYAGIEDDFPSLSGVYRTDDGGVTWTQLKSLAGIAVWSLAIREGDPETMAVGAADGVYLSHDRGETWNKISPDSKRDLRPVVSLSFDASNRDALYAGTTHLPWRTSNGGAAWDSINSGMLDDSDVFSIRTDPHKPGRVFASACSGAYRSDNGGNHWSRLATPLGAFRVYLIALDPNQADRVFAATSSGLLKSVDAGATWKKVSTHPIHSIAFDPATVGRIYFASETAGILVSSDGGDTLHETNQGFSNENFMGLAGDGADLYVNFAASGRTLLSSPDAGQTWTPLHAAPGGNVTAFAAASGEHKILLAATAGGIFRSVDNGRAWAASPLPAATARTHPQIQQLQASGSATFAAVTSAGAFTSEDAGRSWKACPAPHSGIEWYGLTMQASGARLTFAATSHGLFRSADRCQTWEQLTNGLTADTVSVVYIDPAKEGITFAAQDGRVFRSTDSGANWQPIGDGAASAGSNPIGLLILPSRPERLFALFPRLGVFYDDLEAIQ
ncbi:MAG TPA: hypothetical protein VKU01_03310 [Bryobacteraceae bacterium]|nr:hypothetical protein [Bryobacteraceae bacterium]